MANELLISYDRYTLEQIDIYDATDYPVGPVTANSINQTRFLFATVNTINNRQLKVTTLEAYKEYDLTGSGSITVNGVTYYAIPRIIGYSVYGDTTATRKVIFFICFKGGYF